jgi:50S ribosomal subunit-associated GTPase HflX
VVAKAREILAVNKQRSHTFHVESFNLKILNKVEGKDKYCVEVSNRFAALEDLDAEVKISSAWQAIGENIKISAKERQGYYELTKYKQWFDEGCSKFLDQRKQDELQWLQDPKEVNGDNLNNAKREASRQFRNKKTE